MIMSGVSNCTSNLFRVKFSFPLISENKLLSLGWIVDNYLGAATFNLELRDRASLWIHDLLNQHERYLKLDPKEKSIQVVVPADDLSGSQYFTAMMNSQMMEASAQLIELKSVTFIDFLHTLHHDVNFLDLDKCKLCSLPSKHFVFALMDVAMYLHYDDVIASASNYLMMNLSESIAMKSCTYAVMYGLDALLTPSIRYCLHRIDFIVEQHMKDMNSLASKSTGLLLYILRHPSLKIDSLETIVKINQFLEEIGIKEEERLVCII